MKEAASTAAMTGHMWLLLREEHLIQNGITIPSKKILGYAANVTRTSCITRPFLQFMFVEAFVWTELQNEFVISAEVRQLLKKARLQFMTIIYGTGTQQ